MGVDEFLGRVVFDLGQDDGCEVRDAGGGGGGVFGEDCVMIGDAGVEQGRGWG